MFSEFRKETFGDKVFDIIVWIFILAAVIVCVYPFLYVLSVSISDPTAVQRGEVVLLPVGFDTTIFGVVMGYQDLWTAYANTVFYVIVGTFFNIVMTCLAAYPLPDIPSSCAES